MFSSRSAANVGAGGNFNNGKLKSGLYWHISSTYVLHLGYGKYTERRRKLGFVESVSVLLDRALKTRLLIMPDRCGLNYNHRNALEY